MVPIFFIRCHKIQLPSTFSELSSYWFLNTLFVIFIFWEFFKRVLILKNNIFRFTLLILIIVSIAFVFYIGYARFLIFYTIMFVVGYFVQRYDAGRISSSILFDLMIVIFLIGCGFFEFGNTPSGNESRIFMEIPLSLTASTSLLWMFSHANKETNVMKYLSRIGKHTLGIYVCHFYLVAIPFIGYLEYNFNLIMQAVILLIISIVVSEICIAIEKITKPLRILHILLYGKYKIK